MATSALLEHPAVPVEIPRTKPQIDHRLSLGRRLRKDVGASLEYLWELSGSLRLYRADAVIVEGQEQGTGETIRAFYFGHYDNYAFVFGRLFSDFHIVEKHPGLNSIAVRRWVARYSPSVSLLFVDVELLFCRLLAREGFLEIPQWLRQKYLVPNSWPEVLASFRKNTRTTDLRKVRKYGLTYRISHLESDFELFYHTMYAPYLRHRFGDEVIIEPEAKVLRQCHKGELMHILRDEKVVAAVLLHQLAGRLAYVWVGVPEGLSAGVQNGAFSALYYYTILHGYSNGCRVIDFLGSRPLLSDGLFRYKRKWGTHVEDSPVPRGDILLKPMNLAAPIRSFLQRNSLVVRRGRELVGKVLADAGPVTAGNLAKTRQRFATKGIACLEVHSTAGFESEACEWAASRGDMRLVDLSLAKDPAAMFCSAEQA